MQPIRAAVLHHGKISAYHVVERSSHHDVTGAQVPSWTGLGFDMRQRCIELMDAALACAISDKYAREARAEEEAQK